MEGPRASKFEPNYFRTMEKAKTSAPSTTWALLFILLFFLKANGKSTTTTINGEISETRSVNGEEHGVDGDMNGAQYLLSRQPVINVVLQ